MVHGKQSKKAQEETRQHLMHGEQEIDALKQEITLLERDCDKIAEKLTVTTEDSGVLRKARS